MSDMDILNVSEQCMTLDEKILGDKDNTETVKELVSAHLALSKQKMKEKNKKVVMESGNPIE